jgi:hypothetical protein
MERQRLASELMQMQAMVIAQELQASRAEAAADAAIQTLHDACHIPPERRVRPPASRPVVPNLNLNLGPSDCEERKIKIALVKRGAADPSPRTAGQPASSSSGYGAAGQPARQSAAGQPARSKAAGQPAPKGIAKTLGQSKTRVREIGPSGPSDPSSGSSIGSDREDDEEDRRPGTKKPRDRDDYPDEDGDDQ